MIAGVLWALFCPATPARFPQDKETKLANGLKFNIAFTKNTNDEAHREFLKQYEHHLGEARGDARDPGISEELRDQVLQEIDEFDAGSHTINVELSGPEPLKLVVERGPR